MRDRDRIGNGGESRTRVFARACAPAIFATLIGCAANGEQEFARIYDGEFDISAANPAPVTRELPAGVYLLEVREDAIDVRVEIEAAGHAAELLDQVPRHGALYEIVRLPQPGELRVSIRSADHPTKRGKARVSLARRTAATDAKPTELQLGYAAFGEAGRYMTQASPAAWEKAAEKLYEAVAHFDAAGDDAARGQAAYSLANIQYGVRDDWPAAVRATELARDAYDAVGDEIGLHDASALRAAAELELAASMDADRQRAQQNAMYAGVDRRLKEAAEFFARQGLPLRAEFAVNLRAVRAVNVGDYAAAEQFLTQALEMTRANADVAAEARTLANLGAVHIYRGRIVEAAKEYEALEPMIDRETQPYQYAAWLGNYGFTMIALGNFDRALQLHLEALDLYTKRGQEEERANELFALGSLYYRMGDAARALDMLRTAIVIQRQISDTIGLASTLRVAGNAAAASGDHEQALEYLRESSRIDANPHGVARTRVLIAAELRASGRFPAAEAELAEPLRSDSSLVRANALEERARLRVAQGRSDVAEDLRAADAIYRQLGLDLNRIDTNTELSRVLLALGDIDGAAAAADTAISIVGSVRVRSGNPEWRARFLSARYAPFEVRIAVEHARAERGDAGATWRAFQTAEIVRARSLADELAFQPLGEPTGPDQDETELRARLTAQQLRLESRVQRQDPDEAGTLALRREIAETRAQLDSARLRNGGVATVERSLSRSLAQVRALLPADTAVLAYFVGDSRSYAWLLTRKEFRHASLESGGVLSSAVENVRRGQFQGISADAARELSRHLLGTLLDTTDAKRLLIVADGPLHGVPFAALPLGAGDELLVDRFVVGYAPSLALVLDDSRGGGAGHGGRIAVVSDPVYAPDDRRLRVASSADGSSLRGPPQPSPNKLTRLPYSALEAAAVTRAFGSDDTIHLSGFDATPAKVLGLRGSDLAVLHFATHAIAHESSPEQSGLFLTEYTPQGSLLPSSMLSTAEIRRSGLRADVVVLSGCATGDGNELRGEGVLGLTYGFLANGSGSVVATLWPVEDASTARFMSEFYKEYRTSGRAADALRAAQLRFRAGSASPVWSSFVVRAKEFP